MEFNFGEVETEQKEDSVNFFQKVFAREEEVTPAYPQKNVFIEKLANDKTNKRKRDGNQPEGEEGDEEKEENADGKKQKREQKKKIEKKPSAPLFQKRYSQDSTPEEEAKKKEKTQIFAGNTSFENFDLEPKLLKALNDSGFHLPTVIQNASIPPLLQGKDILIKAHTGSGKTLAYLIPLINKLLVESKKSMIKREQGTYGLIISPTRELCLQIFDVLSKLINNFPWMVPGQITGGEQRVKEKARLRKGITILVATPGRLLDHLQNTNCFQVSKLSYLILDEADRLLDMGFEKCIKNILQLVLEKQGFAVTTQQRQNVLASATLNKDVDRLALLSLNNPLLVGDVNVGEDDDDDDFGTHALPSGLTQYYVTVSPRVKLLQLAGFLHGKTTPPENYDPNLEITRLASNPLLYDSASKIIVFVSNCDTVDFIFSLFSLVEFPFEIKLRSKNFVRLIPTPFFKLHGNLSQEVRKQTWHAFRQAKSAVMICTDVAARGLDMPAVNWIVQYDAPSDPKAYIHRIGRTARIGHDGKALLFVYPSELEYVEILKSKKMTFIEIAQDGLTKKLVTNLENNPRKDHSVEEMLLQKKLLSCIEDEKEMDLKEMGIKAYQSFIRSYATHVKSTRHIFHVKNLHIGHVAKSYCLQEVPSTLHTILDANQARREKEKEAEENYLTGGQDPEAHSQPKYMKAKNSPSFEFGA